MSRSTKRFVYFYDLFIYFLPTYVFVSNLMLSSENMYGTRLC